MSQKERSCSFPSPLRRIFSSRFYYEFKNLLFTLEHYLGTFAYYLSILFPPSDYAPPYCYKCKKNWFEMIEDELRKRNDLSSKKS